ncbi:hypothetical protein KAFR_0B02820 [Kazachstania africana CBS 2517]|uniref:Zn(2)-C6 fungal-type domain-containing protein n=1 Tax=Kazachstania africana (strain ATCC 22294 / BCRC 22015 / CBS 2517 / CECT 1963 / NBRC 1671 / NRRL Y-8276) TaxID=1071382 RepID=H2AQC9_KAZAF|nr:hypothetical protein KAFR_0B02820 [Kazachstania africana CBS 2517]CCF56579.1 hypothetical protein KAFR_0B02820 [Kazachstania africana CBS 2517]
MKRPVSDERKPTPSRRLACITCRQRRRKCDMQEPCSICIKFGTRCVFTGEDLRKSRHSASYVKTLENRIALLESSFRRLKESTNEEEKMNIINSVPLDDISVPANNETGGNGTYIKDQNYIDNTISFPSSTKSDLNKTKSSETFPTKNSVLPITKPDLPLRATSPLNRNMNHAKLSPIGGSSIYPSNSLSITKKKITLGQQQLQLTLKNLSRSPLILRSLSLFFKWLYPAHYMFIHRETFLSAFFGDAATKAYYCSEELVFAIAALGCKAATKTEELYGQAENYYQRAKEIVLKKIFQLEDKSLAEATSSSKLALIQTLLCLAFYDIGEGENPMAWYLSGLAFRIAHEIGLHLNPEAWNHVYEDELSKIDFEVRSRIYWGCYIADHLISVLFGRSTSLRVSNSTVPETDELPDIETGIEDYIYNPGVPLSMASPLKKLIVLSRITEIFANKIFIQSETVLQRTEYLSKFNFEANNWRKDLSPDLKWEKEQLKELDSFNPTTTYVWFHYYIVLISYNKPFIDDFDESKHLINDCIEELHYLLVLWTKKFHTFEKCSLYMVYSVILAIQCMKIDSIDDKYYKEFLEFLDSNTLNYEVSKKFTENTNNFNNNNDINSEFTDLFGTLSHGTDFALEYNFDFTLLNEIDKLISNNNASHDKKNEPPSTL